MKREPFSRYWLIGAMMIVFGVAIFLWIIQIQTSPKASAILGEEQLYLKSMRTVYPERGNIYDRWGRLLAGNIEVFEINGDLYKIQDKETVAVTLAKVLNLKYEDLMAAMNPAKKAENHSYIVLARFVPKDKIDEISKINDQLVKQASKKSSNLFHKNDAAAPTLAGLEFTPMLMRNYPEKSLASNILGFYSYQESEKAQGYFGIEGNYNDLLGGKPVSWLQDNDPQQVTKPPVIPPGASLVLTIDRDIQAMTEKVLDNAIKDSGSTGGTILVMDPKTGEMIAMAVQPRMDLNEYWKYGQIYSDGQPFNRAISSTYEPGSVFKVLTMAAAFDAKIVNADTPFLDTGVKYIGGVAIRNWDGRAWGPQTMLGCMQHSLNVCLASVAEMLNSTRFYNYMNNFGIGHVTRIDLAGERNFPMHLPGDPLWYPVNLGTNAFGQGLAATPIQMITAINAVVNHGNMMAPRMLHSIIQDGEERPYPPQLIGRPVSAEAADALSRMLADSLEKESSKALVPGYRVAGKTGTAEIPTPQGYTLSQTNASFVGWGPVDDPRFIVYVWLEKPTTSIWGSEVASPVFKTMVENLVVLMNIPPDETRQQIAQKP